MQSVFSAAARRMTCPKRFARERAAPSALKTGWTCMGLVGVKWFFSPSVPTVAARRVDRLKLLEIEVGDRLEFVGQSRSFEVVRQVVEPAPVLVRAISTATAAAQRLGRGGRRGAGATGGGRVCWRSLARRRACRSAAVSGASWMRCTEAPRRGKSCLITTSATIRAG